MRILRVGSTSLMRPLLVGSMFLSFTAIALALLAPEHVLAATRPNVAQTAKTSDASAAATQDPDPGLPIDEGITQLPESGDTQLPATPDTPRPHYAKPPAHMP